MGRRAAELLIDRLDGPNQGTQEAVLETALWHRCAGNNRPSRRTGQRPEPAEPPGPRTRRNSPDGPVLWRQRTAVHPAKLHGYDASAWVMMSAIRSAAGWSQAGMAWV